MQDVRILVGWRRVAFDVDGKVEEFANLDERVVNMESE
jgi:hypothetical protein